MFWHIPWPTFVQDDDVNALTEIVRAMLRSAVIGFHTAEYVENFEAFVAEHLTDFDVDTKHHQIFPKSPFSRAAACRLHAAPLGVEKNTWSQCHTRNLASKSEIPDLQYVLSVDRCDYTKGIFERLNAIEIFFERFPEYLQSFHSCRFAQDREKVLENSILTGNFAMIKLKKSTAHLPLMIGSPHLVHSTSVRIQLGTDLCTSSSNVSYAT